MIKNVQALSSQMERSKRARSTLPRNTWLTCGTRVGTLKVGYYAQY